MERNEVSPSMVTNGAEAEVSAPSFDDIITEDAIVSSILSSLPLRDSVRTTVLSPRWKDAWIHRPKLYFDAANIFDTHAFPEDSPKEEFIKSVVERRGQFIEAVNSILQQFQGCGKLDRFEVRYYLQRNHSNHLDAWVRFAVQSKTRVLSLYLHKPLFNQFVKNPYDFPCHLLESSSVEELTLQCCSLKPPCGFDGLSHLKILALFYVNVTDEDITHLLSNCYTLEYVKLVVCSCLVAVRISHPQCRLKKLVVKDCDRVREIKLNGEYLSSLYYWGYPVDFIFGQYSNLKDTYILFKTEVSEPGLDFYLNKLSSNLPNVESLTVRIAGVCKVPDLTRGPYRFLQLKRLDLCWNTGVKMSTLHLSTILGASPCLEELILSLWVTCSVELPTESLRKLRKKLPMCPHTRLKKIQIGDFHYETWHIKIALYLLKNATELKSMKIEPDHRGLDEMQKNNLQKEFPTRVKLVIS